MIPLSFSCPSYIFLPTCRLFLVRWGWGYGYTPPRGRLVGVVLFFLEGLSIHYIVLCPSCSYLYMCNDSGDGGDSVIIIIFSRHP